MNGQNLIPRILIIDDLFGRTLPDRRNEERANLCGQYLIEDVTGDEIGKGIPQKVKKPIAQVVFYRGQRPLCSTVGDTIENDLEGTLDVIRSGWSEHHSGKPRWAMVLLDLCFYTGRVTEESSQKTFGMPDGREGDDDPRRYFGIRILQAIHDEFPDLPIIILSSKSRNQVSRDFSYSGALGFLPREEVQSPQILQELIRRHGLIPDEKGEMAGHSKGLLKALRAARRAADNRLNILIRGERGTGKELMARYVHTQGKEHQTAPFVVVNSAALSPSLYASELFGIEKRVATGVDGREGLIKTADGGDIFFDEIGDMSEETQSGILRVLEDRKVTLVGSKVSTAVDVRYLSATNIDIEEKAAIGDFRSDLLDRLREGGTIVLPPLRHRLEDIPLLVESFVRHAESANPKAMRRQIEPEVFDKLRGYDWPGNVRQLRTCILGAVNNYPDVEHLVPLHIQLPEPRRLPANPASVGSEVMPRSIDSPATGDSLDELIQSLEAAAFDPARPDLLAGKLPPLESAYARLIARYLQATLQATSQPSPENPTGKIRIHPAVKLVMGDTGLPASKAADIIKRLLGLRHEAIEGLLKDPVLREAFETSLRLRPRQRKKKE